MAAPAIVQTSAIAAYPNGGAGDTSVASLSGVTSANLLVAQNNCVGILSGGSSISVADGQGSYTQAVQTEVDATGVNYAQAAIHYLTNANSGSHSITSTNNAGSFNAYGWTMVNEVSGTASSPLDKTSVNSATSSNAYTTGSTGTLSNASEIAFANFSIQNGSAVTINEPSGFTNLSVNTAATTAGQGSMDYEVVSATTALNANWGSSGNVPNGWAAVIATFQAPLSGFPVGGIIT